MTDMYPESLVKLGWDSFFDKEYQNLKMPGSIPYRVASEFKTSYRVINGESQLTATMSGKMLYDFTDGYPAVGDWVVTVPSPDGEQGIIHSILPRKSKFSRKDTGPRKAEQIVATNIDTAFIVSALDGNNYNLRRIERYLILAWKSGAAPVLILNKADLCDNPDYYVRQVKDISKDAPVYAVSAVENTGIENMQTFLYTGQTAAFLGSSGVGKSALINVLFGSEVQAIGEIREYDKKGRHTTTRRELILLPGGGVVIDSPGMREIQMWGNEDDLQDPFDDIEALAINCRFTDCSHDTEPGCAVKEALENGELDAGRYGNYLKLQKELQYTATKEDPAARKEEELKWKRISRFGKKLKREKYKG